jgi:hypothetical protein
MELASWIKKDNDKFPILGLESFNTFLKVCAEFSEWALDDIGLSNRNNSYKIWVCKIKPEQINKVKEILERYTSMALILQYYNINIVENNAIALYVKLDWEENKWVMSYGITNNKKLFKGGEFDYTFNTELPENKILKYIIEDINDFNPREHLLLFIIKKNIFLFDPGYCQISDPLIVDKEIVLSTYNLGQWIEQDIALGEAEKYLNVFKNWVKTQKWWNQVHLIVRPRKNKWMDFVIKLK